MDAVNSVYMYVSFWVITPQKQELKTTRTVWFATMCLLLLDFLFRFKLKSYMSPFRASQRDVKNHSLWMFMDAADSLFVVRS